MLFNDKTDEQLEYNLKSARQLSERPLSKVEDVVYLLETVQPRKLAKKPVGSRIDEFFHDPRQAHAITLEATEFRDQEHSVTVEGSNNHGRSLYFSEAKKAPEHNVDVIIQESHLKEKKDKPVPHRNTKDFLFGPFDRPIVNQKCEDGWKGRSRSRSKDQSMSNLLEESDPNLKSTKSPQKLLVFRHIDSVGINSNSKQKSVEQYRNLDRPKQSSAVTPFDFNDEDSSSRQSSRHSSIEKASAVTTKTKPSFSGIQANKPETKREQEPSSKAKEVDTIKPRINEVKSETTPSKPEPSGDLLKELGIERSKEKPAAAIDQINIKKEVIQEMDEEEGSEDQSEKKNNKPFTLIDEEKSDEDRSLEVAPMIPVSNSEMLNVETEVISGPVLEELDRVEPEPGNDRLEQQETVFVPENPPVIVDETENGIKKEEEEELKPSLHADFQEIELVAPVITEDPVLQNEVPQIEPASVILEPEELVKDDQQEPQEKAPAVEDKTVLLPPPELDEDGEPLEKIDERPPEVSVPQPSDTLDIQVDPIDAPKEQEIQNTNQ